jgi:formate C-acetyltransferase
LRAGEGEPWQVRRGHAVRETLRALRFELDECELLIGRMARLTWSDDERREAGEYLGTFTPPGGQTGHCELDRSRLFAKGVDGVCKDIEELLANATGERADAYRSFLLALEGFSAMIGEAARTAEEAMATATPVRREELQAMAESCRRLQHEPPATFRDAIQLAWFMDMGVMLGDSVGLVVSGHLDRTLLPFYERDVAAGRLDDAEALALIECLYILVNELIPDGLAMSVMVGGRDAAGRDVTNPLSYLCLEALRRTGLVYPTVGVCWHEGTPADLTRLASEIVADGCANPAFFGDETIQRGLRSYGVPAEESGNYINSTCVEITPVSSSNVWVASPYFSTCGILREEVAAQAASDAPVRDFSSFLACYRDRLGQRIADAAKAQASLREGREKHGRKPLQSVFTKDCIARGRDIDDGGARYNWVECSFVGLANLVDSLWVVRQEIYEQKVLDFPELMRILDADFAGEEPVRRRFLSYPKYGNAVGEIDTLFDEIVTFARGECARHPMPPDKAHFVPGAFCWVMHERLGSQCGATPDGRRAGTPFADGCGPAQGREACGPTAAVLSTTSWDHAPLIGGSAFNMKFNKSLFADQGGRERLGDLVLTFLRRGGFETQINVVDADRLLAAREHPEDYRDLVVRIGGYTDYFVRLSPGMQDEVIRRTQFATV